VLSWIVLATTTNCSTPTEASQTTAEQDARAVSAGPNTPSAQHAARVRAHRDPKQVTDRQIASAITHTLLADAALHSQQVTVAVSQGIATLSGGVDNLMIQERAAKLAQTILGVRGVVNATTLGAPSRPDNDVRKDVEAALSYDAATESYKLKADVKEGVATLTGTLPSHRDMLLAVFVAKGVKGVKGVTDGMTLKPTAGRSDAEIAAEVKRAIATDVWLHPNFIKTEVAGGVVTLTGSVETPAQQDRADLLGWTAGVKSVNAKGLRIEPWAKPSGERATTVPAKDDAQIKQAVHDVFLGDPRVLSLKPDVDVENGVVTLTGVAETLKANRAAEQDAKNTWGVWRVKNLLRTRPANPVPDDKLVQNVSTAILRDVTLDGYDVNVKAKNGVITLVGTVDSYLEKGDAEDIASRPKGVLEVTNNLVVRHPMWVSYDLGYDPYWSDAPYYKYWDHSDYRGPFHSSWPYASDVAIRDDIEDEIFWSPWVSHDEITVNVVNGVATLSGIADSSFAASKATQAAYEGGAREVDNNLEVR
jgi:osmotically-inducible protein OsmY